MTELSAEKRRKVAEACGIQGGETGFDPACRLLHKDKLTQTTARLIEERPDGYPLMDGSDSGEKDQFRKRLSQALATGDVNAIEALCAELLEHE